LLENKLTLNDTMKSKLNNANALCQVMAYISIVGIILLWYDMSKMVGIAFTLSGLLAMALVRYAMMQAD